MLSVKGNKMSEMIGLVMARGDFEAFCVGCFLVTLALSLYSVSWL